MAKELLEIRNFNLGTNSNTSSSDISQDHASDSLNVDGHNREGRLQGRKDDLTYISNVSGDNFIQIKDASDDSKFNVVYYDSTDKKIKVIKDFYGDQEKSTISSELTNATDITINRQNLIAHFGLGKNEAPKWVGYVEDQLGVSYSDIQIEDAELKKPSSFPQVNAHISDDKYIYAIGGVEQGPYLDSTDHGNTYSVAGVSSGTIAGGNATVSYDTFVSNLMDASFTNKVNIIPSYNDKSRVYKFDISTGELVHVSEPFEKLTAICFNNNYTGSDTDNYTGYIQNYKSGTDSYIWLYDAGSVSVEGASKNFGTIYKVDRATFKVLQTNSITDLISVNHVDSLSQSINYNRTSSFRVQDLMWRDQFYITDICETGTAGTESNQLWISMGYMPSHPTNNSQTELVQTTFSILFRMSTPISNTNIKLYPMLPYAGTNSVAVTGSAYTSSENADKLQGEYVVNGKNYTTGVTYTFGSKALVQDPTNIDNVVILARVSGAHSDNNNDYIYHYNKTLTSAGFDDEIYQLSGNGTNEYENWQLISLKYDAKYSSMDSIEDGKCTIVNLNEAYSGVSGSNLKNETSYKYPYIGISEDKILISTTEVGNLSIYQYSSPTTYTWGSRITSTSKASISLGSLDIDTSDYTRMTISSKGLYAYAMTRALDVASYIPSLSIMNYTGEYLSPSKTYKPELGLELGYSPEFVNNYNLHYYKVSFLYDKFQESPLSIQIGPSQILDVPEVGSLNLNISNLSNLSKRVTHVNIYRSSNVIRIINGVNYYYQTPTTEYHLVESVKLDEKWSGNNTKVKFILDKGDSLGTYESYNFMSPLSDNTIVNYGISAEINESLFVGKCNHLKMPNSGNYIFKSNPFMFNQFDWSSNLIKLPSEPTAIAAFGSRLYAFDDNNMYRIDPQSLRKEDEFNGIGCLSQDSIFVSEFGMLFCDKNNVYLHDGSTAIPIGDPILRSDNGNGYQELISDSFTPKVLFNGIRKSFIVFITTTRAWVYSVTKNRWDLWSVDECKGGLLGKDGQTFFSNGTDMIELANATTYKDFEFTSKKISVTQDSQPKKFYKIDVSYSGTKPKNIEYRTEKGSYTAGTQKDNGVTTSISFREVKKNDIQVKITGDGSTSTPTEIDSIGIVFRRYVKVVGATTSTD